MTLLIKSKGSDRTTNIDEIKFRNQAAVFAKNSCK